MGASAEAEVEEAGFREVSVEVAQVVEHPAEVVVKSSSTMSVVILSCEGFCIYSHTNNISFPITLDGKT